ncbi:adenylate/guanylate cyclase domain-containing protein [Spirulina sp. 06S082]|uniref:adenylate/guanylate cyclase domain-containing protein n=1 Tax=Spirulina sp. 06S082 TaxID=3110248 RepID=UPI002B1E9801|nr:adenylate/guanylate cyclase domain-containing protein [Spirulina sp. 06S082]MEA5470850.1 adenylate/guanylate cyclase domain-containing protein [Spirulina sp. 06S082]
MKFKSLTPLRILLCLGILLLLSITSVQAKFYQTNSPPIEIKQGWQYHWGDSPQNEYGFPLWALETPQSLDWKPLTLPGKLSPPASEKIFWLTVALPEGQWTFPSLYFRGIPHLLEVYFQEELIYIFDELDDRDRLKEKEGEFPIVPLGSNFQNKNIFIKVYINNNLPIPLGVNGILTIGNKPDLIKSLVLGDSIKIALGLLFIFCGILPIAIAILKKTFNIYLSFGFVSLLIGLYTITPTEIVRLLFNYQVSWTYIHHGAFHLLPVSICLFFEHLFGMGRLAIPRRLWQIHLFYAILALILAGNGVITWTNAVYPTQILGIISAIALIAIAARKSLGGRQEAKIFTCGFSLFLLAIVHDIVVYISPINIGNIQLYYWGMLAFLLCLVFILERRFTEAQNYLKAYNLASNRFIPHEFVNFLGKKSIIDIELGDRIHQEMTVLFSDIRSFTSISENMTPEQNFDFLNAYLHQVSPVIREHRGFIDKYIGDAIMALFYHSPENGIEAAIAMQNQVKLFNQDSHSKGYPNIQIGIGLHCGNLMLGTVGEKQRMDTTVIADAVNLASRLETATKQYGASILMSEQTLNRLPNAHKYAYRFLGQILVKGKKEPIRIYEIYEADLPQLKAFKTETKLLFEKAVNLGDRGHTDEAREILQTLQAKNPEDNAVQLLLFRLDINTSRLG